MRHRAGDKEEWEEREYDYLDGTANAIVEVRANLLALAEIDSGATLAPWPPSIFCL